MIEGEVRGGKPREFQSGGARHDRRMIESHTGLSTKGKGKEVKGFGECGTQPWIGGFWMELILVYSNRLGIRIVGWKSQGERKCVGWGSIFT